MNRYLFVAASCLVAGGAAHEALHLQPASSSPTPAVTAPEFAVTLGSDFGTPDAGASSAEQPNPQAAQGATATSPLDATVRIAVHDGTHVTCIGTGTIVDFTSGRALVLTAAHLFENDSPVRIELRTYDDAGGGGRGEMRALLAGRLVRIDRRRDLALVESVAPADVDLYVRRIAPSRTPVRIGDPLTAAGCDQGADPTLWPPRVKSIDKWRGRDGVRHLEATLLTVEGRSGGGLFNAHGQLIGVCTAKAPDMDGGLYVWLPEIWQFCADAGLHRLYAGDVASEERGAESRESPSTVTPTPRPQVLPPQGNCPGGVCPMSNAPGPDASGSACANGTCQKKRGWFRRG